MHSLKFIGFNFIIDAPISPIRPDEFQLFQADEVWVHRYLCR